MAKYLSKEIYIYKWPLEYIPVHIRVENNKKTY